MSMGVSLYVKGQVRMMKWNSPYQKPDKQNYKLSVVEVIGYVIGTIATLFWIGLGFYAVYLVLVRLGIL